MDVVWGANHLNYFGNTFYCTESDREYQSDFWWCMSTMCGFRVTMYEASMSDPPCWPWTAGSTSCFRSPRQRDTSAPLQVHSHSRETLQSYNSDISCRPETRRHNLLQLVSSKTQNTNCYNSCRVKHRTQLVTTRVE